MVRRLALLGVLVALSGFGFYTGTEKATQAGIGRALHFDVSFCTTNAMPGSGAAATGPDGTNTEPGDPCGPASPLSLQTRGQGLIALRLPAGLTLPDTLTLANGVTATRSATYTDTFGAPPAGMQVQGYITPVLSSSAKTSYPTSFDVPVPAPGAGQPFAGPVKGRVIAGYRQLLPTDDGSAGVTCSGMTTCIASVQPAVDFSFPTRDLAIGAPATGTLAFPLRFAGEAGPAFALSATTTVPAGSASPTRATFAPAKDEESTETVKVTVPPGTDPGTYDVTLTAKLGTEARSATGTITVAPATTPTVTATPTPKPVVVVAPTPKPTAVATATPSPGAAPKRAPKSFSLTVKRTGARAFKARGRLKLPTGVVRADGCAGIVKLTAGKVKTSTILTGSCTFSRTVKVKKAGTVKVTARFTGNQVLTAKAARSKRFRAG